MRVFQSSSFRLICALVVPALLSNALPQSLDDRSSNLRLTLFGNDEGEMSRNIQQYPEIELTPQSGQWNKYDVVGNWKGDGRNKAAAALKETEASWAGTVRLYKREGLLLAAGNDEGNPPTWWVIVSTGAGADAGSVEDW